MSAPTDFKLEKSDLRELITFLTGRELLLSAGLNPDYYVGEMQTYESYWNKWLNESYQFYNKEYAKEKWRNSFELIKEAVKETDRLIKILEAKNGVENIRTHLKELQERMTRYYAEKL